MLTYLFCIFKLKKFAKTYHDIFKKNLLFGMHFQISRFYSSFIAWLQYSIHELILIFNDHIKRPICQDKTLIRTHLFVSEATNHIDINTKSVISKAMWWWWSCRIGKKAGKPLTTVWDCVSTFESVTSLDIQTISKDKQGHLQPCLWRQNLVFLQTHSGEFLCLNPTRPSAQCCLKIKWKMNLNKYKVAT